MSAEPIEPDPGPQVAHPDAHRRAVDATRRAIAALRVADAPADDLERAAALLAEAADLLEPHGVDAVRMQGSLRPEAKGFAAGRLDRASEFFPYSPVVGPLNPLAPPIDVHYDGERTRGTSRLGPSYVGPPGMVHGGFIALLFDELLGATNVSNGLGAFTGTLTVRYERPTPIEAELELESWIDRVEGRKVITAGTIRHQGEVTARAEGTFIRVEL